MALEKTAEGCCVEDSEWAKIILDVVLRQPGIWLMDVSSLRLDYCVLPCPALPCPALRRSPALETTLSQQRAVGRAVTLLSAGQMAAVEWQQQSPCVLPTGASDYGVHPQTPKKQENINSADALLSA